MKKIVLNNQGVQTFTAAGSGAFTITIDGTAYTEAFDTSATQTATNWLASHQGTIRRAHNILATRSAAVITLSYTNGHVIEATTVSSSATVVAPFALSLDMIADFDVSSATLVITTNEATARATTITFSSSDDAKESFDELANADLSRFTANAFTFSIANNAAALA